MVPPNHKNVFGNALMVLVLVMLPLMKYFCGLDLKSKTSEIKLAQFWVRFGYVPKINSEF